ncbi:uncharacterized protein LOC111351260 isoform X2 [Spodoptera litura]|uniref:Uncharacterized protein LOC111351260 isoform X2 n=1 Tax=Spodoptera litura TaxID=69820 RepID=A0A9J7DYY0_SPOLT|nr:uncharacterized protein LOC111351260 isoform X2 [Spodoptera litura]
METSYFKNCIVPQCMNTSRKTPTKLFIRVPVKDKMRRKWLKLAKRNDAHCLSTTSRMYFCEDHFDLPNDMLNYTEYHIMGKVSYVRMKPGCLPSKFGCQDDIKKESCNSAERPYMIKKQRMSTKAECFQESFTPSTSLAQQPLQTSSAEEER